MELKIERKYKKENYTIGNFYVNGAFLCNTLEDKWRDLTKEIKIAGQTAIPEGRYRVILSYSDRFKRIMPEILNVPYFAAIRIHSGNTTADTAGCPLLGKNNEIGKVNYSRHFSDKLNEMLTGLNEKIWIEIV